MNIQYTHRSSDTTNRHRTYASSRISQTTTAGTRLHGYHKPPLQTPVSTDITNHHRRHPSPQISQTTPAPTRLQRYHKASPQTLISRDITNHHRSHSSPEISQSITADTHLQRYVAHSGPSPPSQMLITATALFVAWDLVAQE